MSSSTAHFRFVAVGFILIACVNLAIDVVQTQGAGRNLSVNELARYRGGQMVTYDDQCCVAREQCVQGEAEQVFCGDYKMKGKCEANYSNEWPSVKRQHCTVIKNSNGKKCTVTVAVHHCWISHSCIWDEKNGCINLAVADQTNAPDDCDDDCNL
jgi:hypothetical protein